MNFRAVILLAAFAAVAFAKKGILELDDDTFDKVLKGRTAGTLVAFVEYSWKDPDDYEKVAKEFDDVIVAKVAGNDSPKLKERFGVSTYPTVKYFPSGSSEPVTAGSASSSDLIDFVRLQQNPKLQELKQLAQDFLAAAAGARPAIQAKAEELVKTSFDGAASTYASYFTNTIKKIAEKGDDFLEKEAARLKGLVDNKSTVAAKREEFQRRLNVLKSFGKDLA
eukprot:TRINITY_DN28805_c0_g1_i1.p2 TRINITY_DN28805_c0_g1~~TRINITY_DN28805_c0_g1_i1.p2  ORF type:complete len:223 (-),score=104.89 TRINITY_DN28805_c0_g1_i1:105-773(-)